MSEPEKSLFGAFQKGLEADPDWAWSWHCNIAMPIKDHLLLDHARANWAAARLMQHLFAIDITKHRYWQYGETEPPMPNPKAVERENIAIGISVAKEAECIRERIEESMRNELHSKPEADSPESLGRRLLEAERILSDLRWELERRGHMP